MRPHVGHHRSRPRQRLLTDCWPSAAGCGRPARAAVSGVEGLQQVGCIRGFGLGFVAVPVPPFRCGMT